MRREIRALPPSIRTAAETVFETVEILARERDNVIALAKELLAANGVSEKDALSTIFRRIHGGMAPRPPKAKPW